MPNIENIIISVEGDIVNINSDKATSIALIVNELLQNSLEHAFKGRDEGRIDISVRKGSIYSSISVTDNGIGFNAKSIKSSSLGLNIVKSMVKDKLNGHLIIDSNKNGTEIVFDFKND